jgi:enoyl-[acyl-carrier-protein] reductase (NADH)
MTNPLGEDIVEQIKETIPMKRLGEVDDVASILEFLCSDGVKDITGQVIYVDAGIYM